MIKDETNLSYRNVIENATIITDIFYNIIFDNDWNNNFLGSIWIDFIADHTNYWSKMLINEYKDSNNDCHPKSFYERRFPLLHQLYESIFRIYEKLEIRDNLSINRFMSIHCNRFSI
jgi:ABC-type transport system substrate-binding protein